MVYLNKIYTKAGDAGETALGNGTRVRKTDLRIAAYGAVDELNSLLGVCRTVPLPEGFAEILGTIQNDLFDLGADLCVPESEDSEAAEHPPLRVRSSQAEQLEDWIDELNEQLEPLTSFVLPGGTAGAAQLHLSRSVCRRVELEVFRLLERDPINPNIAVYLNRLSDLLFVMARIANAQGRDDVLWVPGGPRQSEK